MATATAKRPAQRFLQKDIPTLINAYKEGGLDSAYQAFGDFEPRIVRNKLVKLGIAQSARPTLTEDQKGTVASIRDEALAMLHEAFGEGDSVAPGFVRALIAAFRDTLPKNAAAEDDEEAA